MVGIRSFPIGFRPIFRCKMAVSFRDIRNPKLVSNLRLQNESRGIPRWCRWVIPWSLSRLVMEDVLHWTQTWPQMYKNPPIVSWFSQKWVYLQSPTVYRYLLNIAIFFLNHDYRRKRCVFFVGFSDLKGLCKKHGITTGWRDDGPGST